MLYLFFVVLQLFVLFPTVLFAELVLDSARVKLEVYVESACPVSQAFVLGELTEVFSLPDVVAVLDFIYVPFGKRQYNETLENYECMDKTNCETDAAQLCAQLLFEPNHKKGMTAIGSGANSISLFPFISCVAKYQGLWNSTEPCWEKTIFQPGLSKTTWAGIDSCVAFRFRRIMTAGSIATPENISSVPWVLVDSIRYDITRKNLLQTICNAYTGSPLPRNCKKQLNLH